MIFNTIILEDSPLQLMATNRLVHSHPAMNLLGSFTSIENALPFIESNKIDLLFTDVEMPGLNGFEVMARVPENIKVVMNSTRSEFAVPAMEAGAEAFLTKPIERSSFNEAVRRVKGLSERETAFFRNEGRLTLEKIPVC